MLGEREVRQLFEGRVGHGCVPAGSLYRCAQYSRCASSDAHCQFFWVALYELSAAQLRLFLTGLARVCCPADSVDSDDLLYCSAFRLDGKTCVLRICAIEQDPVTISSSSSALSDAIPLTAGDSSSAVEGETVLCLRLPRYSSLQIATHHLLAFLAQPSTAQPALL